MKNSLRGGATGIDTHLVCLERNVAVGTTKTKLHCYFVALDAHGRPRVKRLAEFLRNRIVDYSIPRHTIQEAFHQAEHSGSTAAISNLHERARSLFTHLANSGEGGELLLFAMAEAVFQITQVICKMSLKTSTSMHYHGADGVYAEAHPDGGLNLYWAESKIYSDPTSAIRDCLHSLAPFLRDPEGEDVTRSQDILLINEFASFDDEALVNALRKFLDKDDPSSLSVHHCGFALAGFDSPAYPAQGAEMTADQVADALSDELNTWTNTTNNRVVKEALELFDIHFICVPLPSAEEFRRYFLQLMGVHDED